MSLEEIKEEQDKLVEAAGLKFILDTRAQLYMKNITIDYRKSVLGEGFSITSKDFGSDGDCC